MGAYNLCTLIQQDIIDFRPAQNANGSDATACVGLLSKRRPDDESWAGDETEKHLLFQYVSRVTHRLYPLIQDLRYGLLIPPKFHKQATGLGLKRDQFVHTGSEGASRRQRFFSDLIGVYWLCIISGWFLDLVLQTGSEGP